MHIIARTLSLVLLLTLPGLVLADKGGKGPSDRAYESASDNASFKRTDGKPGKAKKEKHKEKAYNESI